ncbi:type IV pilus modification protein PilV [Variovorax sp. dw_308]|uniref:type IV pilus modification protein PilV n=1 Tax=Variovorax sp. dw_308 TaxID=2721546 RepID=UPI001C44DB61|nr:type IV pilus modification protein PilV [Variovorax sp. dw_308]
MSKATPHRSTQRYARRQHKCQLKGATLIEALVSLLVMSFGLLGLAGLQASGLTFQKAAWSMHRVTDITSDIGERIRANPKAMDADYQYTSSYATGKAATLTKLNCRTTGACTAAQTAADDLADLLLKAQTLLPQGSMQITGTVAGGFVVTSMYMDKDFLTTAGTLDQTATCTATTTGIDVRNCCPAAAAAPAGVRCRNFTIVP